ncbi:hypothetical protein PsYK624_020820 [Phanerochaete sordida]|uniref:Uncharacterized protein n=1 Tax=Phanerochaete sordida TaxID=48140 RepID=A0A9P3FZA6_9APHY|nr:hypothetical protein PsYK624_020820 [Phanerochaete sordida]
MSSSARLSPHRRRSHSASSPLPASRHSSSDKWRTSSKRQRAGNPRSPSCKDFVSDLPTDKWDVDRWRRGKKARRDSSSPLSSPRGPCLFGSSPVFREPWAFVPPSSLPSTSDAFQLFPSRPKPSRSVSHHSSPISRPFPDQLAMPPRSPDEDTTRLRSTAFGELQRSIEESGDCLVSRMRDWEREHAYPGPRPASSAAASLGEMERAPGVAPSPWAIPETDLYDDEDDIQIVSGDPVSDGTSDFGSRPGDDGEDEMDLDQPLGSAPHDVGARLSSPGHGTRTVHSAYSTDDESPALSFSTSSSISSSLVSLPGQPSPFLNPSFTGSHTSPSKSQLSTSPSEKAIAALALVMANGAGGLNDYGAVLASEQQAITTDDFLVGEMWH